MLGEKVNNAEEATEATTLEQQRRSGCRFDEHGMFELVGDTLTVAGGDYWISPNPEDWFPINAGCAPSGNTRTNGICVVRNEGCTPAQLAVVEAGP